MLSRFFGEEVLSEGLYGAENNRSLYKKPEILLDYKDEILNAFRICSQTKNRLATLLKKIEEEKKVLNV